MDLSYEAIQAGAREVVVCHRGGFLSRARSFSFDHKA